MEGHSAGRVRGQAQPGERGCGLDPPAEGGVLRRTGGETAGSWAGAGPGRNGSM